MQNNEILNANSHFFLAPFWCINHTFHYPINYKWLKSSSSYCEKVEYKSIFTYQVYYSQISSGLEDGVGNFCTKQIAKIMTIFKQAA